MGVSALLAGTVVDQFDAPQTNAACVSTNGQPPALCSGLLAGPGLAPSEQLACRLALPEASSNRLNDCAERNPHATHDELEPIKALIKIAEGVERLGAAVLDAVGTNLFETL